MNYFFIWKGNDRIYTIIWFTSCNAWQCMPNYVCQKSVIELCLTPNSIYEKRSFHFWVLMYGLNFCFTALESNSILVYLFWLICQNSLSRHLYSECIKFVKVRKLSFVRHLTRPAFERSKQKQNCYSNFMSVCLNILICDRNKFFQKRGWGSKLNDLQLFIVT